MAPSSKNKKLTLSGVLKSLKETGKYDYPKDIEAFYKLATSKETMMYIVKEGFLRVEAKKNEKLFQKTLPLKVVIGKKVKEMPAKQLSKIVKKSMQVYNDETFDADSKDALVHFSNLFKRVLTYTYKGKSILDFNQYSELEEIEEEYPEPKAKKDARLKLINKLPQESICLIAHLIFLGKIFIETNESYLNLEFRDEAVTAFFVVFAQHIFVMDHSDVTKKQEKFNKLAKQSGTTPERVSPKEYPTLRHMVFDIWKEEFDYIPMISDENKKYYNLLKYTVYGVLNSLQETGEYDYPDHLKGFYKMATSEQMMQHIASEKGSFKEPKRVGPLNKIIPKKQDFSNAKKIKINKFSFHQLSDITDKFMQTQTTDASLFTSVFKRLTIYYFKELSVLNESQYSELEKIYAKCKESKAKMAAMIAYIDQLSDISICVVAHLIFLGKKFVKTCSKFQSHSCQDAAVKECFATGPVSLIFNNWNVIPGKTSSESKCKALEHIVFDCWRNVLNYFNPVLSKKEKMKYSYFADKVKS